MQLGSSITMLHNTGSWDLAYSLNISKFQPSPFPWWPYKGQVAFTHWNPPSPFLSLIAMWNSPNRPPGTFFFLKKAAFLLTLQLLEKLQKCFVCTESGGQGHIPVQKCDTVVGWEAADVENIIEGRNQIWVSVWGKVTISVQARNSPLECTVSSGFWLNPPPSDMTANSAANQGV